MKIKIYFLSFVVLLFSQNIVSAQSAQTSFKLVSWNMEWFGSTSNGPHDLNLQEANAVKILRYINADIMGLVEVVDTLRFHRVVDSLGANYDYAISPYCSNNTSGTGNGWLSGQKLAFIYNKNIVSNVSFRGFMRTTSTSSSAYVNWAAGRFPFLMNADVTLNGITKNINFFVIHGKAEGSPCDVKDYNKKYNAALEMKDSLDAEYPHSLNVIIGDYNDDLWQTISTCAGTQASAYTPIISDTANYKALTLPLAQAGDSSMIDYAGVIDNHIASKAMDSFYVLNSVHLANEIRNFISNYTQDNTSDHYPVYTVYSYTQQSSGGGSGGGGTVTAVSNVTPQEFNVSVYPNPTYNAAYLHFTQSMQNVNVELFDAAGNKLLAQTYQHIINGQIIELPLTDFASGIIFAKVSNSTKQTTIKLLKL